MPQAIAYEIRLNRHVVKVCTNLDRAIEYARSLARQEPRTFVKTELGVVTAGKTSVKVFALSEFGERSLRCAWLAGEEAPVGTEVA